LRGSKRHFITIAYAAGELCGWTTLDSDTVLVGNKSTPLAFDWKTPLTGHKLLNNLEPVIINS